MKKIIFSYILALYLSLIIPNYAYCQVKIDTIAIEMKAKNDAGMENLGINFIWAPAAFLSTLYFHVFAIGGLTMTALAFTTGGDIDVPDARIEEIKQMYPDNISAIKIYEDKYKNTYRSRKRLSQVTYTLVGAGTALYLLLTSAS